jgi:hypothetical protein
MRVERIATSLLVAVGLFAASVVRAQQEPPPFPGGSETQASDDASQGPVTDANTTPPSPRPRIISTSNSPPTASG